MEEEKETERETEGEGEMDVLSEQSLSTMAERQEEDC